MVAVAPLSFEPPPPVPRPPGEERVRMFGVPWEVYVALRDAVESPAVRMTYSEGELEIMTALPPHEIAKKMIARLVELYALEADIPINGYGNTTFRDQVKKKGLEPDECYCVGHLLKDVPDLAIEVVITSGGMNKLPVYKGLGVREVWFWKDDAFHLYSLRASGYEPVRSSEFLPGLDLEALARFARLPDQHEAAKAFRDWLRGKR